MGENETTTTDTPAPVDPLAGAAAATPDKAAIVDEGTTITYAELNARVNQLANGLLALGMQAGERAVWCGPNSTGILTFIHAARKIGMVAVPAAYRFTAEELQYLADNSDSVLVVADAEQAGKFAEVREQLPKVRELVVFGGEAPEGFRTVEEITAGQPEPFRRWGISLMVRRLAVTSSPTRPSPRVAPWTSTPSS